MVNNSSNTWDYTILADVHEHYFEDLIIYLLVHWAVYCTQHRISENMMEA